MYYILYFISKYSTHARAEGNGRGRDWLIFKELFDTVVEAGKFEICRAESRLEI